MNLNYKIDIFEAFDMDLGSGRLGQSYWRGAIRRANGIDTTI